MPDKVIIYDAVEEWDKINESIYSAKNKLDSAKTTVDYQAIGVICREIIILLAKEVYNKEIKISADGKMIGKNDAKRQLESYVDSLNDNFKSGNLVKFIKSTITYANELTHKDNAEEEHAKICFYATSALVNIISSIERKY